MVVDLLDYDVRFGQGFLFSPPRPVRAEALQSSAPSVDLPADLPASSIVSEGSPELVAAAARR
jgi:cyclic-di-GMP phosphodiesterase TipF (flagellum assembly factor)